MAMVIDKRNGNVAFSESTHQYFDLTDPGKKYISVTTLIHKFEPPFDKDFWSAYKAVEKLINPDYWPTAKRELLSTKKITDSFLDGYDIRRDDLNVVQQEILDGWWKENRASTRRGSEIHAELEHSFYAQKTDISLQKYGVGGKFTCVEGKTELDLENGIYPEYLVYYDSPDGKLHLAGQIDLLVKQGDAFSVLDWKGLPLDTELPTPTGWTTMGDVGIGDKLFDRDGRQCSVTGKSVVHDNPCMKMVFANGDSVVADDEHRWVVNVCGDGTESERVMTTREIMEMLGDDSGVSIRIMNAKPLECSIADIDVLPARGDREMTSLLEGSLRASVEQRMEVRNAVCYECVDLDYRRHCYTMRPKPYADLFKELMVSLGYQVVANKDGTLSFGTMKVLRNTACGKLVTSTPSYRTVCRVIPVKTVPTQCIEVDSPSGTYLCTRNMIVTHNTNKQIKRGSYYDKVKGKSEKLAYPLNDLDSCNYSVYNMQLSTYAWMIEMLHPEWKCNDLVLVHFDHDGNMTTYRMEYLKEQVERMLEFWKKQSVLEEHREQRKRIEY